MHPWPFSWHCVDELKLTINFHYWYLHPHPTFCNTCILKKHTLWNDFSTQWSLLTANTFFFLGGGREERGRGEQLWKKIFTLKSNIHYVQNKATGLDSRTSQWGNDGRRISTHSLTAPPWSNLRQRSDTATPENMCPTNCHPLLFGFNRAGGSTDSAVQRGQIGHGFRPHAEPSLYIVEACWPLHKATSFFLCPIIHMLASLHTLTKHTSHVSLAPRGTVIKYGFKRWIQEGVEIEMGERGVPMFPVCSYGGLAFKSKWDGIGCGEGWKAKAQQRVYNKDGEINK